MIKLCVDALFIFENLCKLENLKDDSKIKIPEYITSTGAFYLLKIISNSSDKEILMCVSDAYLNFVQLLKSINYNNEIPFSLLEYKQIEFLKKLSIMDKSQIKLVSYLKVLSIILGISLVTSGITMIILVSLKIIAINFNSINFISSISVVSFLLLSFVTTIIIFKLKSIHMIKKSRDYSYSSD
ncbi:MAG: hypothetical protein LBJ93_00250 [Clostridiales bacterium]|nr:hypothetical protein [Clostridiales bacterium]